MPLYEYACDGCRTVHEVRQRLADEPLQTCPRCGQAVRRLISAPSFNSGGHTSPTAARYARMSPQEEISRERELQRSYETLAFPPGVKHAPDH
jgi:putative FmdB family regulatory protein